MDSHLNRRNGTYSKVHKVANSSGDQGNLGCVIHATLILIKAIKLSLAHILGKNSPFHVASPSKTVWEGERWRDGGSSFTR